MFFQLRNDFSIARRYFRMDISYHRKPIDIYIYLLTLQILLQSPLWFTLKKSSMSDSRSGNLVTLQIGLWLNRTQCTVNSHMGLKIN